MRWAGSGSWRDSAPRGAVPAGKIDGASSRRDWPRNDAKPTSSTIASYRCASTATPMCYTMDVDAGDNGVANSIVVHSRVGEVAEC